MAGQQFPEGTVADGPNGPIVFRNGGWQSMGGARPAPQVVKLGDPRRGLEMPLAQADLNAKRQEAQIRALQLRKLQGEVAPPGSDPRYDGITGPEYLKHLPPTDAAKVRALAEGRMAFPSGAGMRSPYWQQMIDHVAHFDPTFDAVNYAARAATRKDFTSGKSAANIRALNTAIGHLGQLADAMHGTQSGPVTPLNAVGNFVGKTFLGDPGPGSYDQLASHVSEELTAVFRNGGGAASDVQRNLADLSSNASEAQKRKAFQNLSGLLQSRLDALGDQYTQGMGTTRDGLSLLNPHAQKVFGAISEGRTPTERGVDPTKAIDAPAAVFSGSGGGNTPPAGPPPSANLGPRGGGTPDRSTDISRLRPDAGPGAGPGGTSVEQGSTERFSTTQDRAYQAALQGAFNKGATRSQLQGLAAKFGYPPLGADLDAAIAYRDKGGHGAAINLPQSGARNLSLGQQYNNWAADSDVGTGAIHAGLAVGALPNGATRLAGRALGFNGDMRQAFGNPEQNDAVMSYLDNQHHKSAITGDIVGGVAGAGGLEALAAKGLVRAGVNEGTRSVAAPLIGDTAFGALQGAGNAQQGSELQGSIVGSLAGLAGGAAGRQVIGPAAARALQPLAASRPVMAIANAGRGMLGRAPVIAPEAPTVAQQQLLRAATPDIAGQLDEASRLRVPMSLADTTPAMTALGGAVIRRSPTARRVAEDSFLPRSRGQIDRFGNAVTRDLGPVADIPQTSADLTEQARTAAAPLYERAYAAPGASTVNLEDLLPRPSMRAGLARAYRIAQEEGRDPTALGFNLGQTGEVELGRVPSFQTLDYVKRGVDDALEPHRNPLTGRLALNEDTRAINGTRSALLGRMDAANPDYAAARAAYAGPTQARDALSRGADAFGLSPDELRFQVRQQTPEHLGQMQLGFRSEMMNRANNLRDTTNPFESVLGSPAARSRVDALHPGNNENLFRTRDLELQIARSQNGILGGSPTAERSLADVAMSNIPGLMSSGVADMGLMGMHAPPLATLGYMATKGIKAGVQRLADRRIASVADELAPTLFNPDPAHASAALGDLLNSSQAYRDFVSGQRRQIGRLGGMLGASVAPAAISGF